MTFCISLAGVNIEVSTVYDFSYIFCRDYLTDGKADMSVEIRKSDIDSERTYANENTKEEILELTALYRKICLGLISKNIILCHGSAVSADGEGFLFTADSGTGKSTHTSLWRKMLGSRAEMVNDDKPLIRFGSGIEVCGTPWCGKEGLNSNISVPLRALCLIERSENNRIERLSVNDAFQSLMRRVYRPADEEKMKKTLELTSRLAESVPFYRLFCNISQDAAALAYSTMKEGTI